MDDLQRIKQGHGMLVTIVFYLYSEAGKKSKISESEIEKVIRLRLKNASDHDGGRKKRAERKKGNQCLL